MNTEMLDILRALEKGEINAHTALLRIKAQPFEDIGFAKVDTHRAARQGCGEVIYGEGKSAEQIFEIAHRIADNDGRALITRLSEEKAAALRPLVGFEYYAEARIGILGGRREADGIGTVLVVTGGTSDIYAAEEAALTAEFLGNSVERLYDVGVAGLHRLLANVERIMSASVIVAVAGMEGALASVVGGLSDCPVIAVPTSVGYGASFGGLSALLSMLNSCASGVTTVNIDNGFGAGYTASLINHMESKK